MDKLEFIRAALQGYNFSTEKVDRLTSYFSRKINERSIENQDYIYQYVTSTIESWISSYRHKRTKSLDAPLSQNSETTLLDIVGVEDSPLEKIINTEEETPHYLKIQDIIEEIKDDLDKVDYKVLKDLSFRAGDSFRLTGSIDAIKKSVSMIRERVKKLSKLFYTNGWVLPKTMEVISFDPLELRFGRLNGTTLLKIREANSLGMSIGRAAQYAGVTRNTVMNRWRSMRLKSPYARPRIELDDGKIKMMDEAHNLGMTQREAAEFSGTNVRIVQNHWKENGLKPTRLFGGDQINNETKAKIFEAHTLKMRVADAARYAGVSGDTVTRRWESLGLKPHYKGKDRIEKSTIEKVYEAHEKNMTIREAALHAGASQTTVFNRWRKKGLLSPYRHRGHMTTKSPDETAKNRMELGINPDENHPDEKFVLKIGFVPLDRYNREDYAKFSSPALTGTEIDKVSELYDYLTRNGIIDEDKTSIAYRSDGYLITYRHDSRDYVMADVFAEKEHTFIVPITHKLQSAVKEWLDEGGLKNTAKSQEHKANKSFRKELKEGAQKEGAESIDNTKNSKAEELIQRVFRAMTGP